MVRFLVPSSIIVQVLLLAAVLTAHAKFGMWTGAMQTSEGITWIDVGFNATGSKVVTASADGTSRVYNTQTGACQAILIGHEGEISKVCFNPQGTKILTASSDKTARIWEVESGDCLQVLEGHTDEIFSCAFNYEGDTIITGSKDNTCRIWKCW